MSAAYRQPPPTNLRIVLSIKSVSSMLEVSDAISRIAALDAQTIGAVRAKQSRLDALRRKLVADRTEAAEQLDVARSHHRMCILRSIPAAVAQFGRTRSSRAFLGSDVRRPYQPHSTDCPVIVRTAAMIAISTG